MQSEKPLILLCNDDGIFSPGLRAMAEAVADMGEILIAAPSVQQTSMGRSYPQTANAGIIKKVDYKVCGRELEAYSVEASPAAAVAHGVLEIAHRKPDLLLSGVNYGENLGCTITYSGTVGACLAAADFGILSIAFSRPSGLGEIRSAEYAEMDWSYSAKVVEFWTEKLLKDGCKIKAPILNINIPERADESMEYRFTFQSHKELYSYCDTEKRDFSKSYRISTKKNENFDNVELGSDIYVTCVEKRISVTPLNNDLTYKTVSGIAIL